MRVAQALLIGWLSTWAATAAAAGAPADVNVTISPTTVVANYSDTALVTAIVYDGNGAPVPNQAVLVNASGTNNGIIHRSGTTDASGTFTTPIRSNVAQVKLVTVTAGDITAYGSMLFVPGPPSIARCTVSASPKINLIADGISTSLLTASVQDIYANPIEGVPITIDVSGSENHLSVTGGNTSSSGLFMTALTSTHAETKSVSITAGSITANTNVMFIGASPNATYTQFVVSPNAILAADQNQAFLLRVYVRDDHNNAIPNYPVAFSIEGKSGRFDATDGYTTTGGIFSTGLRSSTIGDKQIYASAGMFSDTKTVTFTYGAPRSGTSSVVASPNNVIANDSNTASVVCTVRDASSNPIPNVPISLSVNGNRNTLSATSGVTNAFGNFNVTLSSAVAENKTVTMTAGTATARGNVSFVAGAPNATLSRLTVNPNAEIAANNSALFTLTSMFVDDFGNPAKFLPVHFASSGQNDILSDSQATTSTKGIAYTTLRSTSMGDSTITVTGGNVMFSTNVTFTLGALSPFASKLVASPNSNLIADSNHVSTITATLRDIVGHKLANQNLTIASNGLGDTLGATSGTTDANGVFATTLVSTRVGTKTVTLFASDAKTSTTVSFIAGPPSQTTTNVEITPNNVVADNRSLATVTTTVLDAYGNGCRNTRVNLAVSDSNSLFAISGGNTGASGSFATSLRSSLASSKTVTATVGAWSVEGNVRFVAGPPNTATSVFVISPNANLLANNADTATLSATLRDAFGNATQNVRVLLTGSAPGNTFTPMTALTDANGTVTSAVRCARAAAERVTLSAGTATLSGNVTFSPGPPDGNTSTLELLPYSAVVANGSAAATVTATVRDQWNNPVPAVASTMASSNSNDVLSAHSGNTTTAGTFVTAVRSTRSGARTITFGAGDFTLTVPSNFIAGPANANNSTLSVDSTNVPADNMTTVNVTAVLRDAYNNPLVNQWTNFSSSGSRYQFLPSSGATDSTGTLQATFRSSQSGAKVLKAQAGTFSTTTGITFVAGSPNSFTTKVTANPNTSVPANGTTQVTLKALVLDIFSNPVGGQSVTFSSNGNNDSIANANGVSDANGVYTTTMTSFGTGARIITIDAGGATANVRITFVAPSAARAVPSDTRLADKDAPARPWAPRFALADFGTHGPLMAITAQRGAQPHRAYIAGPDHQFYEGEPLSRGGAITELATGDVDGDGIVDVVAIDPCAARLQIYAGREGGGFAPAVDGPVVGDGRQLVLYDADGDGRAEAYVLGGDGQRVAIWAADAHDAWTLSRRVALAHLARSVAVVAAPTAGIAQLWLGGRDGIEMVALGREVSPPTFVSDVATRWLSTGDLNGDGIIDVVALSAAGRALHLFAGASDGGWAAPTSIALPGHFSMAITGDADGDGHSDVAVAGADGRILVLTWPEGAREPVRTWHLAPGEVGQLGLVAASAQRPAWLVTISSASGAPALAPAMPTAH